MRLLIDETVILRYLLEDSKTNFRKACSAISSGDAYTYPEIIARVAVALRDVYGVPRTQIGYTLEKLLDDIYVVEEDVVRYAVRLFGSSMLDFVDCLLVGRNALHGEQIMSFDKPLLKRTLML
ncbi:PIN domain-containing protein [Curtanaerobium respiraculi]|jgi:predicted nucleic-acid-binding protein|uniref:PIN domain-containing protein n=1 Tax=Curtanaerobium respiraculi TaxID=2949669 RepID=UPI0024B3A8A7|nr:type II toxin-antitoxin system VapC family toxin [Curtanaerobium respiraculi]